MKLRAIPLVTQLAVAAGCSIGPSYEPPRVSVPPDWSEAPAEAAAAPADSLSRWWIEFDDETLEHLIARAAAGNLDLKIASARIREARAARGIAASGALPQSGAGASYARTSRSEAVPPFEAAGGGLSPFGPREQNAFEAGFDASWEIDVFGGVRRDVEAAVAQVQAEEEARRDVLVTLLADVARSYTELRSAQRQLQILDDTLRAERETLALVSARFEAGLATGLDVSRAEGLLAATEANRPALERIAKRAIHRLGVLIGEEPGSLLEELDAARAIPPAPPEVPLTLPSELLSRRPDLRRAERELAAATARIGVARADLFPRFSIRGSFGRRSDDPSELGSGSSQFWGILPGVHWPILSGGRIQANIRVQTERQEQALLGYEKAVLTALEEVENALVAYSHERRRERSLRDAVAANREALDLATERYTGGLESFLAVLDAQRSVYATEDEWVKSRRDVVVAAISIHKALGGGWE